MSNLGFHALFDSVSWFHGVRTARFFLERDRNIFSPEAADRKAPSLFGRQVDLRGFDAVFFTVSFELDFINILTMLGRSGIPLRVADRGRDDPIVICGGIVPTANPRPLAAVSDFLFLGDMEGGIDGILKALSASNFQRSATLFDSLAGVAGVMRGGQEGEEPARAVTDPIVRPAHSVIITDRTEFSRMFLVEIVRGCNNRCRFCMTRCAASPARSADRESILNLVRRVSPVTPRVGLIGPVLTDHPELAALVREINAIGGTVSFSSLRADRFTDEIARLIRQNGQRTVTFAPETGSELLRGEIGKNLSNGQILDAVKRALEHGVERIRYYFMYGLPGESRGDILDMVSLVRETALLMGLGTGGINAGASRARPERIGVHAVGIPVLGVQAGRLHLSINPFVPKRGTRFAAGRPRRPGYYREMQNLLMEKLGSLEGVVLRFEPLNHLYLHSLLSVGGIDAGNRLVDAFERGTLRSFHREAERYMIDE
jgi:radical SAM superfamily enzyme YgiQ (UPF0313 family)